MQVIHSQCAGLDVHKKTVVVTCMLTLADGTIQKRARTFATMTADLLALDDWLKQQSIDVIALESTGVYCTPSTIFWRMAQRWCWSIRNI